MIENVAYLVATNLVWDLLVDVMKWENGNLRVIFHVYNLNLFLVFDLESDNLKIIYSNTITKLLEEYVFFSQD